MIDVIASLPHYAAHLAPIVREIELRLLYPREFEGITLVASHRDLVTARKKGARRIVLAQHGAGQSYGGDPRSARHPSYPGGDDNEDVGLFLVPNEHAAKRWRDRYPRASVKVVGCPRLDTLPERDSTSPPVVAVSFHFDPYASPEARSAFAWYRNAIPLLARHFNLIGHGHPKATQLPKFYARHGIEYVSDFDDVCRRADVYVCDNSSTLFEFASTGRQVVVMNAPWYRRDVDHGLRFWTEAGVGLEVDHPGELPDAVASAPLYSSVTFADALDRVYEYRTGGAQRAAEAVMEWAS